MHIDTEILRDGFSKYHLIGFPFPVALHHITELDHPDLIHNHPTHAWSYIFHGWYIERIYTINDDGTYTYEDVKREQGTSHYIAATHAHQIIEVSSGGVYTLTTPSEIVNNWGFYKKNDEGKLYFEEFKP